MCFPPSNTFPLPTELILKTVWCYKDLAPMERKHLRVLHCTDEFRQRVLGISVKHPGYGFKEERVFESRKTFALASLQHNH